MMFRRILGKVALAVAFLTGVPVVTGLTGVLFATQAEAATLAAIQVRGNVRIDSATIRSYVPVRIGAEYGQGTLNDTLVALFVTGLFADVEVTGLSGTINIVVVENPVVAEVAFVGNRRVNTDDLTEIVQTASRGVLSTPIMEADKQRILQRYEQTGRSATVVVEVQQLGGNVVNVLFRITEGARQRIATIDFVGNTAFSDRQLASVVDLRESGLLSWLSKNDIYSPEAMARDGELLRRHYLSTGYADFQVLSTNVATDPNNGDYIITINLSEGPLYRFGPVRVDSTIAGIDQNTFRRDIHIAAGRVFNAADLEQTLEDMAITLSNAGHPFARVVPRANRDYTNNTIELTLLVDEGARIYIERIDIAGNERTRDYVIRREFDFAEGDAYNRVLVDRVERRLRSTGLFDQVAIIEQQGSGPDQVILLVQVEERRTGQVSFTAGYSTADGIMGEISLTEENFLGRGQYLRLAFSIGPNNRNYSISFTEPYFLGRRLPIGFDIYRRSSVGGGARPFDEAQNGGQIRLGLPLTESLALQLSYRFVNQVISNTTHPFFTPGTINTSSITYGFTFSTIDNPRDPSRGLFLRASQELAGLGGNNNFLRSTVDARLYQPLGYNSPIIAAFRVQAGDIRGRNGQEVRVTDLFQLGGDNIRGFANAGFGPREIAAPNLGIGGQQYWTVNAELRFPFPILPPDAGFRGAVFADAGVLTGVPASLAGLVNDGAELRASIGASIMWASPIGLLRLDFARVLRSASYDITQAIRFSIGGEF